MENEGCYAVYAQNSPPMRWQLQAVFDTQEDANRHAEALVRTDDGERWDEAIVEFCPSSRADVPEVLPQDRVAPITARFVRPGYA